MRAVLAGLEPEFSGRYFDSAPDMLLWLASELPSVALMSLDYDLGGLRERDGGFFHPGTGGDVVGFLAERSPVCPVIVHTSCASAAEEMLETLRSAGWESSRVAPVSSSEWIEDAWAAEVARLLFRRG